MAITEKHLEAIAAMIRDAVVTYTDDLIEAGRNGEIKLSVSVLVRDTGQAAAVRIRVRCPLAVLSEEEQAIIDDRQLCLFAGDAPKAAGGSQ
ncbi:MAG: hypothetical protein WHT06_14625 [Desulfobacterales bacterium]